MFTQTRQRRGTRSLASGRNGLDSSTANEAATTERGPPGLRLRRKRFLPREMLRAANVFENMCFVLLDSLNLGHFFSDRSRHGAPAKGLA